MTSQWNLGKQFALVGANLIDGTGSPVRKNSTIVVKEVEDQLFPERAKLRSLGEAPPRKYGIISEVGPKEAVQLDDGIEQIDATGLFVMPGLFDCHVHFWGRTYLLPQGVIALGEPLQLRAIRAALDTQKLLDWGFTTIRGCGGNFEIHVKKAVEEGSIVGPRVLASGPGICRTGGEADIRRDIWEVDGEKMDYYFPFGRRVDGPEEIRKAVRDLLRHGVDFVKCWVSGGGVWYRDADKQTMFTKEELEMLVSEANMLNVPVAMHVLNKRDILSAVELGCRTIEHCYLSEGELEKWVCQAMVAKNQYISPTVSTYFAGKMGGAQIISAATHGAESARRFWLMAREQGVKFIMGSDTFTPLATPYGIYGMEEMVLRTSVLDMSPMEIIVSATQTSAEAMGILDKVGTVEPGKIADLLVLKENPADRIEVLLNKENILHVIKEGQLFR
jgi:imidazolonepropionase-like amidohydrolase